MKKKLCVLLLVGLCLTGCGAKGKLDGPGAAAPETTVAVESTVVGETVAEAVAATVEAVKNNAPIEFDTSLQTAGEAVSEMVMEAQDVVGSTEVGNGLDLSIPSDAKSLYVKMDFGDMGFSIVSDLYGDKDNVIIVGNGKIITIGNVDYLEDSEALYTDGQLNESDESTDADEFVDMGSSLLEVINDQSIILEPTDYGYIATAKDEGEDPVQIYVTDGVIEKLLVEKDPISMSCTFSNKTVTEAYDFDVSTAVTISEEEFEEKQMGVVMQIFAAIMAMNMGDDVVEPAVNNG